MLIVRQLMLAIAKAVVLVWSVYVRAVVCERVAGEASTCAWELAVRSQFGVGCSELHLPVLADRGFQRRRELLSGGAANCHTSKGRHSSPPEQLGTCI